MVTINNDLRFDYIPKSKQSKNQIILINSEQPIDEYILKLTKRYNRKYDKIPTFTISRTGIVYQHLNISQVTNVFDDDSLNQQAIVICLENVGWLEKDGGNFKDWRGILYNHPVQEIKWRNKLFWATYTEIQFMALSELLDYLCMEYSIEKQFVGNNVYADGALNYHGILNRSNISKNHYDLSPPFDFQKLKNEINK